MAVPAFASQSAFSFPGMPTWLLTQDRDQMWVESNFWRALQQSWTAKELEWRLLRELMAERQSELIATCVGVFGSVKNMLTARVMARISDRKTE